MTAITSTSRYSSSRVSNICNDYTVEIYDFDNDVHTYDVSAHNQTDDSIQKNPLALFGKVSGKNIEPLISLINTNN